VHKLKNGRSLYESRRTGASILEGAFWKLRPGMTGIWRAWSGLTAISFLPDFQVDKAAEGRRSPKRKAFAATYKSREASWSAPVLWRFLIAPQPTA
jgi:hypothetical protein